MLVPNTPGSRLHEVTVPSGIRVATVSFGTDWCPEPSGRRSSLPGTNHYTHNRCIVNYGVDPTPTVTESETVEHLAVPPLSDPRWSMFRGNGTMSEPPFESGFADELISVCRTVVGDELRSITYFTEDDVEQVYLRSDLNRTADLVGFAEVERVGLDSAEKYRGTQLGDYQATVRMFEHGYLTRVVHQRRGVWVTTDIMSMERFEELYSALSPVLEEHADDET